MKRALVTGSARGLGAAIAAQLLDDGYRVIGVDLSYERGVHEVLPSDDQFVEIAVDLSCKDQIDALVNWIKATQQQLDLLVNNAMWIHYDRLADLREEDIDKMLAIGFKAPLWLVQATAPLLKESRGSVVNISSAASIIGIPGSIGYGSIKGAISAMTRHMAVELSSEGVRVNAVAPGYSPTPGVVEVVGREGENKRIARTPLSRVCEPEDIAGAVSYLASPKASFVTGQVLVVDGGITISL